MKKILSLLLAFSLALSLAACGSASDKDSGKEAIINLTMSKKSGGFSMKCMVIDGNSIINRAYYGIRPLTNREGLYTHAVFGFLTTLLRLKEEERPDALCVTFDLHAPTFRHKADEAYKACLLYTSPSPRD